MVMVLWFIYLTTRILFIVEFMQIIEVGDVKTKSVGQYQCLQCLSFQFSVERQLLE